MIKQKAAIFDLDGTLVDSMHVWENVDKIWLSQNGIEHAEWISQRFKNMMFSEGARFAIDELGIKKEPEEIMTEWNDLAQHEYETNVKLKPGVYKYLEKLKSQGVKMAVATSCLPDCCNAALFANDIRHFFDAVVFTQDAGRGKAYPDVYLLCAQKLSCAPEDCVVDEDSYMPIAGVHSAGMRFVGVYDPISSFDWDKMLNEADLCINTFEELL